MHGMNRRAFLRHTLQLATGGLLAGCNTIQSIGATNVGFSALTDQRGAPVLPPLASALLKPAVPIPDVSLAAKIGQMIMMGINERKLIEEKGVVKMTENIASLRIILSNLRTKKCLDNIRNGTTTTEREIA